MKERIKRLRERIAKNLAEGRQMLDKAEKDGARALNAEEKARWETCMADVRKDRDDLVQCEEQEKIDAELRTAATDPLRESPAGERPEQRNEEAQRRNAAFRSLLRNGANGMSEVERRDLQVGPSGQGGYLVPVEFSKNILLKLKDMTYIRSKATVLPVTQSDSLGVPSLDAEPADPTWTSEVNVGANDTQVAFGKRELRPHPLAKLIKISRKLLRASAIDVEALIRDRIAYRYDITEENAFLNGNGANQPLGLFTASSSGIDTSRDVSTNNQATSVTGDGLMAALYFLKKQYRKNAEWLFHRNALSQISQLKDAMGRYLFQPGISLGAPDLLLGRPYNESEYAPSVFTTGQYVGVIGDLSYYWIVDSLNMEIQVLFELYAASNQIGYIARKETDGMPALAEAFARVKLA